ncbi:hypothetical protein Tco_0892769 [Tanacetum coccineum]|uniref:Uncharacterized protein n=1 Tax=Tanacetum coccineum TaxID=301880 RepID=A0ABQ5C9L8_9ASTR
MHNNIMAAGSKERPPMLGPGRYSQWHSPVEAAENILPVAAHEEVETIHNMTAENKLYFQAEKEAIFLILTGIGDEIYSTVDACNTAKEMWTAIERLQQGESLNVQDVKTNLFWEFGKFTSRDGESMESYYSRQSANPLQFLSAAQPYLITKYYTSTLPSKIECHPPYKHSSSHEQVCLQHKGKEIAKPVLLLNLSQFLRKTVNPEQASEVINDMQKNWSLLAKYFKKRTNLPTTTLEALQTPRTRLKIPQSQGNNNDNQSSIWESNDITVSGAKKQKPKRVKDITRYHNGEDYDVKQAEQVFHFKLSNADWLEDTG